MQFLFESNVITYFLGFFLDKEYPIRFLELKCKVGNRYGAAKLYALVQCVETMLFASNKSRPGILDRQTKSNDDEET